MGGRSGIVGASLSSDDAARTLYRSLQMLRHRGGRADGIAVHDGFQQRSITASRLAAFERADLDRLSGSVGIARTSSRPDARRAFEIDSRHGPVALGVDGDPHYRGDRIDGTEPARGAAALGRALAAELADTDVASAVERIARQLVGHFALVALHDGTVVGVRGPSGGRPLALGTVGAGRALASESVVFDVLGGERERDVEPGELVVLQGGSVARRQASRPSGSVDAVPELVHHARPDSVVGDATVWAVRSDLGRRLHAKAESPTGLVVPGSETGRPFAVGYARAAGTRPEGVVRWNRYARARPPLSDPGPAVVADAVRGERVTLIDSTLHERLPAVVSALDEAGARAVDVRVAVGPETADVDGVSRSAVRADRLAVLGEQAVAAVVRAGPDAGRPQPD